MNIDKLRMLTERMHRFNTLIDAMGTRVQRGGMD
jgi:hypothetical protein